MIVAGEQQLAWWTKPETAELLDVTPLIEQWSPLLYQVAFSVLRNAAEAEDVVQETFVRVLQRRERLAEITEMRAWLARIAWNLAIDRRRRPTPEQLDDELGATLLSSAQPIDEAVAEAVELRRVMDALDRLPKLERAALLLGAVEELSVREVAVVMGKSESAVRALTFRGRKRLQERLGKGGQR